MLEAGPRASGSVRIGARARTTSQLIELDRRAAHARSGSTGPRSRYEMLYGIRRDEQLRLAKAGYHVRGPDRLRRGLVPVVHAPPRRAARERAVRAPPAAALRARRATDQRP